MKNALPYIFIAVLAGLIVGFHPLLVYGLDNFSVSADYHKVFSYGFPFRVNDSSASSIQTPAAQVPLRVSADFVVWFAVGCVAMVVIRTAWRRGLLALSRASR